MPNAIGPGYPLNPSDTSGGTDVDTSNPSVSEDCSDAIEANAGAQAAFHGAVLGSSTVVGLLGLPGAGYAVKETGKDVEENCPIVQDPGHGIDGAQGRGGNGGASGAGGAGGTAE
jgi:hypothetical protein